jgi:hypothetical protein|tara:strand:- start:435 stop:653 length:219 start_codon:yes stop_codon:yes gene_type:complete
MEIKKIMRDKLDEFTDQYINEIDNIIIREIIGDIINGSLYVTADDVTVQMMLESMWESRGTYERAGVVSGDA